MAATTGKAADYRFFDPQVNALMTVKSDFRKIHQPIDLYLLS